MTGMEPVCDQFMTGPGPVLDHLFRPGVMFSECPFQTIPLHMVSLLKHPKDS